jgi:co-chaperonin GroES (HSP10)
MNLTPLADRVVIEPVEVTQDGPIYIPSPQAPSFYRGVVCAIGDLVKRLAVGDAVLFKHRPGVEVDGGKYIIIQEVDVVAVVNA